MSSPTLTDIQAKLSLCVYSICMVLGNIGNAFIVILFSRQRQNACSIYLLSAAIVNNIYLLFYGFTQLFPFNYRDETPHILIVCKICTYLVSILGQVAKTLVVLACIDRFLITSDRATFRVFSTPKRAKYAMFFSIIFWSICGVHTPIMTTIVNGRCSAFGIYSIIFSVYAIIVVGLIPSITSGIFGYLAYCNMKKMHNRVQPVMHNINNMNNSIRRRDRDLLITVISEVIVYIITTAPFPLMFLEMIVSQYILPSKSFQYTQIEIFIFNIAILLLYANSGTAFYTYIIVSKSFRRDFKQLIINGYRKPRRQPPVQTIHRGDQIFIEQTTHV